MTSFIRALDRDLETWVPDNPGWRMMSGLGSEILNCSIVAFVFLAMATPSGPPDAPTVARVASVQPALPPSLPIVVTTPERETPAVRLRSETPDPVLSQEEPAIPRNSEPEDTASPTITASPAMTGAPPTPEPDMDVVNQYLWAVYQRSPVKRDGSGDFTWKDSAAAAHTEMSLGDYVIRGMDRDFRELLYRAGLAMDAAGFRWTILSGFRDDYRQALASGYKARVTDTLHGGSATTGGYGHGCAVDIRDEDGNSRGLWVWLDAHKAELDLDRPLPGLDPAHVQPRGPWHETGTALRDDRLRNGTSAEGSPDLTSMPPSEEDMRCIGLHHRHEEPAATIATAPADAQSLKPELAAHRSGETPTGGQKAAPKQTRRVAAQRPASEGSKPATRNKPIAATSAKLTPSNKATARTLARHVPHPAASNAGRT
jgi:hypothetical protein